MVCVLSDVNTLSLSVGNMASEGAITAYRGEIAIEFRGNSSGDYCFFKNEYSTSPSYFHFLSRTPYAAYPFRKR